MITRRYLLRFLAGLPFLSPFSFPSPGASAQLSGSPKETPKISIGETFAGEELHYEISLWLLERVASVRMTLLRAATKGQYLATIQGETVGLAGLATRHRKDTYRAVMEEIDGGRRFRSLSFDEQVKIGKDSRRRSHTFDHQKRKWVQRTVRRSGARSTVEKEIPEGREYNDFLTAAYNFRYGVYGSIERGQAYQVPVFPKTNTTTYDVKVLSRTDEDRLRQTERPRGGSEYRIDLTMDPEILQSATGLIEGWLSKELYPVEGTIKDVLLFGDARGVLLRRIKRP